MNSAVDLDILPFLRFGLLPWPLVVVIEDCYVPKLAPDALRKVESMDFNTISAIIACRSYQAQQLFPQQLN